MSDSSVNNFLGDTNNDVDRSSDSSVNRFMKSTKDYDGYEPPAQPEAQGPSVLDKLKATIAGIVDGIGEHYDNNARQAFDGMKDENGNVTPESAKQAEGNGDSNNSFGNTNYESADNPIASAAYDPGYDIQARQDDGSFGGNFRRDVNAWGSTVAGDVSTVYNSGGTEGKWKLYEDAIADPAMKFAATPFIPAPARAAAGLVAAPDFISGVVNSGKKGYGDGDGSVIGGMAGVVNSLVTQPLEQLAQAALHPIDTAQSIHDHPGNLWNNVLEPGMVAEMGIRGGKKVYDNRGAIGDFASDAKNQGIGNAVFDRTAAKSFDDMGNNYSQPTDSAANSQLDPRPQAFSTGVDANVDSMVAGAAAKYQLDPALLAKLVDQESTYGRDPNAGGNLAQISNDLAQQYGLDSSDPAQSIEGGARYLKSLIDANGGDVRAALAAYNGGPGNPQFGYADQVLGRDIGGEMGKTYSGGDNSGATSGEGAYEAGSGAWMGATMPSGPKGCVEAATRVGSFYDGFLKDEAEKGVASVPTLIADAGERFIPFDEKSLEKGDVIVYDGDEHVVTYDGNGGYVGNSTGQGRIVHGSDYHEMGGMTPTGIIKASDRSGGGYKPEQNGGNDVPVTDNGDVDIFGNKLNDEYSDEPMATDGRDTSGENVAKSDEDVGRPADMNWGDSSVQKADSLPELTPERQQDIQNIDRAIANTADTFERNKLEGMKQNILQNPSISNKDAMAKSIQDIQYSRKPANDSPVLTPEEVTRIVNTEMMKDPDLRKIAIPEKGSEYSRPEESDFQKVAAAGDYAKAAELARQAGETDWSRAYEALAEVTKQPAPRLGDAKPTGQYTGDTVTKAQILKRAQELFVPIRTGRIGIRDVNGLANHASGVIRERSWGDLPTMAHEMGHMVDAALSLRGDAGRFDGEFSKVVNRRFGEGAYEPGAIRGEGIAEFMKDYMKSDAEAQKNFPQYYTAFKNKLADNPDIEARVNEIKSMYQKWEDQSPEARGRSAVTYAKDSKPAPMERIKNGWNSFVEGAVDDKDSLQRATESYEKLIGKKLETKDDPYKMARLAQNSATARAQMLVEGKTPEQVKTSLNKVYGNIIENGITLKETLSTLDKQVKGKYGDYLQKGNFDNWHEALDSLLVARRQAEIQELYPGYTGPMSRSDASYIISHAPAELTAAAKKIYTYNDNIMRILRETGMIKSEVYDALADKYRNYVPMARDFSDEAGLVKGFGIGTGYANVRAALKSLSEEGSSRSVQSPLESIVKNTYTLLNLAERNRVGQTFARMAQGDRVGRLVEEVKGSAAQKDSTFSVWENGQKHVYQTTPEIYRAIMSVNKESGNIITKLLSPPAGLLRAGATLMPDFALKNIMRDSFGAAVFSRYGFRPVIDHIAGVFHMVKQDQLFQDYKASGALMSTMVGLDRDFVQASLKGLYKKNTTYYWKNYNPVQILRGFSEILETATRLGEYNRAIKKGASMEDAALSARDISLDFSKAGSAGRQINKVSAFFNAGVQEPARIFEAFKEAPAKTAAKTALYITLPSIALWTINHNQEWYQETPDWEKNIFWMFKAGGTIYRIPKPFGLGVLFGSLPERSLDWMYGKDPQSIKKWADSAKDAFLPNLMPTAIVPIMEWMTNYSFFRNRSIVPGRLQKLPDAQQFGPNTSELAKDIGKMFNLSPMKLDNLIRGYGAGMATQTLNAADALTGNRDMKNPFTAAFTADPMQSPQSIQDFYDKLNDTEKAYNGAGGKTGAKGNVKYNYQLMQHANKVMQDLNKKERAAVGARNQSAIDDINNKQLKAARDALKMIR